MMALTDSELWRIDQILADGFETAWKWARHPRIEAYLQPTTGPYRQVLLRELLLLDVHYRRLQGETPRITDYQHRFPELIESWPDRELTSAFPATAFRDAPLGVKDRVKEGRALEGIPTRNAFPFVIVQGRMLGKFRLLEGPGRRRRLWNGVVRCSTFG